MKLLTIDSREVTGRPGVLLDGGDILDLAAAPKTLSESQWIPHSVVSVLAAGPDGLERTASLVTAVDQANREQLLSAGALLPYAGTELLAPIRRPGLVLIVDAAGSGFIKNPNAAVGPRATLELPWASCDALWATPLLACVIGKPFFKADAQAARDAIAGYTLMLDMCAQQPGDYGSRDDWQAHNDMRQYPGACPIGPVIVTCDEWPLPGNTEAAVLINEVEVARSDLWAPGQDPGALLAELSQRYGFRPGDLVAFEPFTEPADSAFRIQPGDTFTVSCAGMLDLDIRVG